MYSMRFYSNVQLWKFLGAVLILSVGWILGVGTGVASAGVGSCEVNVHNVHNRKVHLA